MKKVVCIFMVLLIVFPVITISSSESHSNIVYAAKKKKSVFNKIPKTGDKNLDINIKDISKQYDDLIKRVNKIAKNPDDFSQEAQLDLINDQSILMTTYNDILEQLEELEDEGKVSTSKYMKVLTYLQKKNNKLLVQFDKLPDDLEAVD